MAKTAALWRKKREVLTSTLSTVWITESQNGLGWKQLLI